MIYKLSLPHPSDHYLNIEMKLGRIQQEQLELQFPNWRPGRYELGNFSAMVRKWTAMDEDGNDLVIYKKARDRWLIENTAGKEVTLVYDFYANTLNAGSTFVSDRLWMLNPVNFLMYIPGTENEPCKMEIDRPDHWSVASSLKEENGIFQAASYHELVDSPLMLSEQFDHWAYNAGGIDFHIWIYGEHELDQERVLKEFRAFSENQIKAFGGFPTETYHFLLMFHPDRKYHGVEHLRSTVIWLGPQDKVHEDDVWEDLLGICSHELYHSWNIKTLRPIELMPYDYSREMYFRTGYVAEGVTTYMGDVHLIQSGAFDWLQFKRTQEKNLYRHLLNDARDIRSVAESSKELWLDGYGSDGAPGRISSIYAEGALFSLMIDLSIILNSSGQSNLSSMMRALYEDDEVRRKGYSEQRFLELCVEYGGEKAEQIRDRYICKAGEMLDDIQALLTAFGVVLKKKQPENIPMAEFGFRALKHAQGARVTHVVEGGPAWDAGLEIGMIIEEVNGKDISGGLSEQLTDSREADEFKVTGELGSRLVYLHRKEGKYFSEVELQRDPDANAQQIRNFEIWTRGVID